MTNHVKRSRDVGVQGHIIGHCPRGRFPGWCYFKLSMLLLLHDYCSCAVLVLQVTFIHTSLVFLPGTGMKMQTGQCGDSMTMWIIEWGWNWGNLVWLVEQAPSVATISSFSGSVWWCCHRNIVLLCLEKVSKVTECSCWSNTTMASKPCPEVACQQLVWTPPGTMTSVYLSGLIQSWLSHCHNAF